MANSDNDDKCAVGEGALVRASAEGAELLQEVEAALDTLATTRCVTVEVGRPSTSGACGQPLGALVATVGLEVGYAALTEQASTRGLAEAWSEKVRRPASRL